MRRFDVQVTFPAKGVRYSMTHRTILQASTPAAAAGRAMRQAKKRYPRRFQVRDGTEIRVKIIALAPIQEGT